MTEQRSAILGLFGVALIWGISYVMSAFLLHYFSPILLSFLRVVITLALLLLAAFKTRVPERPTKMEWLFLFGSSVFFTLIQQPLYFIGLRNSTAANASIIYAAAPLTTIFLEAYFLKVQIYWRKVAGAILGFIGVLIIIGYNGKALGISHGDLYLFAAMLGFSISLLFIPRLSTRLSSMSISIYSSIIGIMLLFPFAAGERLAGQMEASRDWLIWALLLAAGILTALAGIWWIRGVAVAGAGTAALFNNIPPFIALITGYLFLGDSVHLSQILGGILVLAGVFISNKQRKADIYGTNCSSKRQSTSL